MVDAALPAIREIQPIIYCPDHDRVHSREFFRANGLSLNPATVPSERRVPGVAPVELPRAADHPSRGCIVEARFEIGSLVKSQKDS